jgi:tetratricopeptide (TPR) repeat protein
MQREETNFRAAVDAALAAGAYAEASSMGDVFREYLERAGRLRERDAWVARLADEVGKGGFSAAVAARERDAAWALFSQGHAGEAEARLEALLERLRGVEDFDPAFEIAAAQMVLGRVYDDSGYSVRALPVLEESVRGWEALLAAAGARGETAETERGNLAVALGDLANASRNAGRLDEALAAAERGLAVHRELGHDREVAADLIRTGLILAQQGRFGDADVLYHEAIDAARHAGDRQLEGSVLQNLGSLATDRGRYAEAAERYRDALKLFQEANDEGAVMRTCNLLGSVEQIAGRLAEARSWYERSREIAEQRQEPQYLAQALQNLGIILQKEGDLARDKGDEKTAKRRFEAAADSVRQGLGIRQSLGNEPDVSASHSQLAKIYLYLGEPDRAEDNAHRAREITERLGLKEAHIVYHHLAQIARARGNATAAAEWETKRNDLLAELERRAGGSAELTAEGLQAIVGLTMACVRARVDRSELAPQAEAALAQLAEAPAPLDGLASFLRAVAAGEEASVPAGLPEELREAMVGIVEAGADL